MNFFLVIWVSYQWFFLLKYNENSQISSIETLLLCTIKRIVLSNSLTLFPDMKIPSSNFVMKKKLCRAKTLARISNMYSFDEYINKSVCINFDTMLLFCLKLYWHIVWMWRGLIVNVMRNINCLTFQFVGFHATENVEFFEMQQIPITFYSIEDFECIFVHSFALPLPLPLSLYPFYLLCVNICHFEKKVVGM